MPPVTTALIVANVAIYLLQGLVPQLVVPFALWPIASSASGGAPFAPWQLVTYAFLHGGLLLAYGMYFPHNRVMLLFPPIPMRARVFVVVYAVLELFLGVTGSQPGVAHFAHLGGMAGAWLLMRFWRGGVRRPLR